MLSLNAYSVTENILQVKPGAAGNPVFHQAAVININYPQFYVLHDG